MVNHKKKKMKKMKTACLTLCLQPAVMMLGVSFNMFGCRQKQGGGNKHFVGGLVTNLREVSVRYLCRLGHHKKLKRSENEVPEALQKKSCSCKAEHS